MEGRRKQEDGRVEETVSSRTGQTETVQTEAPWLLGSIAEFKLSYALTLGTLSVAEPWLLGSIAGRADGARTGARRSTCEPRRGQERGQ